LRSGASPSTTGIRLRPGSGCTSLNPERSTSAVADSSIAGRGEQRRHQVDVRCRRGDTRGSTGAGAAGAPGAGEPAATRAIERHAGRLVVELEPLLVQAAVRPEQLAVVGGPHEHRVAGALFGDRAAHPVDGPSTAACSGSTGRGIAGVVAVDRCDPDGRPVAGGYAAR
jgi:hypothetical protein